MEEWAPDVVVQFGATPVSKKLNVLIHSSAVSTYWVVDYRDRRIDPSHSVTNRSLACPETTLLEWANLIQNKKASTPEANNPVASTSKANALPLSDWQRKWQLIQKGYTLGLNEVFSSDRLTEQATAKSISRWLPVDYALTVGSSNPVRHMDSFAVGFGSAVPVLTNRGASGIDGTVASGIGYSLGHQKRPLVFLGDLSLLHDLNSLALCAESKALVVVINNDGGGIFSHLPVRAFENSFEPLFGTPHGYTFKQAATMFGMEYQKPTSVTEFISVLEAAGKSEKSMVIEIETVREENRKEVDRIKDVVGKSIAAQLSSANNLSG